MASGNPSGPLGCETPSRPPWASPIVRRALFAPALAGVLLACDLPTESPRWDQRWIIPADETSVGVEEFLPDGVDTTPDGTAFSVAVAPFSLQASLEGLCTPCQAANGLTVPKPPFQGAVQAQGELPATVSVVDVEEGRILILARNGFGFDPLRPAPGSFGTLTLSLLDGSSSGTPLDQVRVDGASEAFPPGSTLTRTLEFAGEVEGLLRVVLEIDSPLGDPVTVDVTEDVTVEATVETLHIASAVVDVSGRTFDLEETPLDLDDLDEGIVDRIQSGALEFSARNPWALGASFSVTLLGPFAPISKAFSLQPAPTSVARIEFSGEELRSFLGRDNVRLVGSGTIHPDAGEARLYPGQSLDLDSRLDIIIRVGGGEG